MAKAKLADMPKKTARKTPAKAAAAPPRKHARVDAGQSEAETLSVMLDEARRRSEELLAGSKRLLGRLSLS